jgi:selenocysteine lyase/cysteine desulfurase
VDIDQLRQDTPATSELIHLNNAGSSLSPLPVFNEFLRYSRREQEIGGYEAVDEAKELVEKTYQSLATLLHVDRADLSRFENSTRAWDMAFYALPLRKGDRILTTVSEYGANYISYLQVAKKSGVRIEVVPNDEYGQIDLTSLERMVADDVKLISLNHLPTNSGQVNPAEEIGKIAQEHNILYQLDICQSVGQLPLDNSRIRADILSGTSRKYLRGPRGTGFLYTNTERIDELMPGNEPPLLDHFATEWVDVDEYRLRPNGQRYETFEFSYASFLGFGKAIEYALNLGLENTWRRIRELGDYLREELETIDHITVQDIGRIKSGIVTFSSSKMNAQEIKMYLRAEKVNVSVGDITGALIDMRQRGLEFIVRSSVHYYNTRDEIDRMCDLLRTL